LPKYLLFLLTALIFVFGCGKSSDIPIIASGAEYQDRLAKAQRLSADILEKYENGEALTEADKAKLREAQKEFAGLIAFAPNNFGAYFGASKIEYALGRPEAAFGHMQKFIELAPADPIADVKRLLAEAHFVVAKAYEDQGEFELVMRNAEQSVKYFRSPDYLAMLASALLREGREEAAHKLVDEALKADPEHSRAKQLHSLMKRH
jgi:tetratricopeptide (TPR) repeat protein